MFAPAINDMFVNLVGKADSIKFLAQIGNKFEFVKAENFSGRIVRVADNYCLCFFIKSGAKFVFFKIKSVIS